MDAMSLSNNTAKELAVILSRDYPKFTFEEGKQEQWSPKEKTIFYNPAKPCFGLLHELAHALLDHSNYQNDFELIKLESEAWQLAAKIGQKYKIKIDEDYIQTCLDTYRDWLHRRSACPSCGTHVLQSSSGNYQCFNCNTSWHVSSGRFVRSYRKTINGSKTS
jgi:hypothetical protein